MVYDKRHVPTLYEKLLLGAIVLLILGLTVQGVVTSVRFRGIEDRQLASREVGLGNRATTCRLLIGLGLQDPDKMTQADPCNDPKVLKYYDPQNTGRSTGATQTLATRKAVCEFLAEITSAHPEGFSVPADCMDVAPGTNR